MTDEEMLACATEFTLIPFDSRRRQPMGHIRSLKVAFRAANAWAIVDDRNVLNRDGEWEYEPFPSARDDGFFARCRWPTAREAIAFAEQHMAQYPSGYKED
jgi:hypothetical protein